MSEDVKTYGAGVDHDATWQFQVEVHHRPTRTTWLEQFTAWVDPGPQPVLTFLRASASGQDGAELAAAASLIVRALDDTDGTPWAQVLANVRLGRPTGDGDDSAPADAPDPWDEPAPPPSWSSSARFNAIVDSLDHHVAQSVILELATDISRAAFGGVTRPTRGAKTGGSPRS